MEYIPWFVWIVLAAMLAGVVITVANTRGRQNAAIAEALKQSTEANERLIARLDGIESRLTSVEKTLSDIPE